MFLPKLIRAIAYLLAVVHVEGKQFLMETSDSRAEIASP